MRKLKLPRCPYCGKPLNFFESFVLKSHGEYYCSACNKNSKVTFEKSMYKRSWICEIVALAILVILVIFTPSKSLLEAVAVFLPFLYFYIMVPFDMVLVPCKQTKVNEYQKGSVSNEQTVCFSPINKKANDRKKINSLEFYSNNKETVDSSFKTREIPLSFNKQFNDDGKNKEN